MARQTTARGPRVSCKVEQLNPVRTFTLPRRGGGPPVVARRYKLVREDGRPVDVEPVLATSDLDAMSYFKDMGEIPEYDD